MDFTVAWNKENTLFRTYGLLGVFLNLCFLSTSYIAPRNTCIVQLIFLNLGGKVKKWFEQALLSMSQT